MSKILVKSSSYIMPTFILPLYVTPLQDINIMPEISIQIMESHRYYVEFVNKTHILGGYNIPIPLQYTHTH